MTSPLRPPLAGLVPLVTIGAVVLLTAAAAPPANSTFTMFVVRHVEAWAGPPFAWKPPPTASRPGVYADGLVSAGRYQCTVDPPLPPALGCSATHETFYGHVCGGGMVSLQAGG